MPSESYAQRLRDQQIPLSRILLDPNNPRLLGIEAFQGGVSEGRYAEEQVQQKTLDRLNGQRAFDQESLRNSIEQSGLLPIDRIVVRPARTGTSDDGEHYVVVEGNRRIAACKTLLQAHESGDKDLPDHVLSTIREPSVLVLAEGVTDDPVLDQWVLQGVRHISGIRPWGPYQAAKAIEALKTRLGYTEHEVSNALSISVQRVRRSLRVLSALQQMAENEDYAEYATPDMYTYFDEVVKRPAVRQWLGWSNESGSFEDEERAQHFYSWITPDDDLEGRPKIGSSEGVRRLDAVLQDPAALEVLNTPGKSIDDALTVAAPTTTPDWTEPLARAIRALDAVPISDLEDLSESNRSLIEQLVGLANRRLGQADSFKK